MGAGGPGAYEGQWELLRRTYESLAEGAPSPIPVQTIEEVNRLLCPHSPVAEEAPHDASLHLLAGRVRESIRSE